MQEAPVVVKVAATIMMFGAKQQAPASGPKLLKCESSGS